MPTKNDFLKIENDKALAARKIKLIGYECIDSTSTEARRHAEAGGEGNVLFLAKEQSAGRGRTGKSFYSPHGTGIYMTLLLDITDAPPASVVALTSAAAVAVAMACESVCGVRCGIKWVNDIYVGGKKVCGILAESFEAHGKRFAAVGVGINLSTADFPEEIASVAGSLSKKQDKKTQRELTLAVCTGIFDIYEGLREGDFSYMQSYRERSAVLGKQISFWKNGIKSSGTAVAVSDSGALEVRLPDGSKETLSSGEITLRLSDSPR